MSPRARNALTGGLSDWPGLAALISLSSHRLAIAPVQPVRRQEFERKGRELSGWLVGWLFGGWVVGWLAGCLADRLVDWLACWLAGLLVAWLAGLPACLDDAWLAG